MKTFVWIKSLRGPSPVLFHDGIPTDGSGKEAKYNILQRHPIKDGEEMLTLNQLMILYPYKDLGE